jgi:hypothetical protein
MVNYLPHWPHDHQDVVDRMTGEHWFVSNYHRLRRTPTRAELFHPYIPADILEDRPNDMSPRLREALEYLIQEAETKPSSWRTAKESTAKLERRTLRLTWKTILKMRRCQSSSCLTTNTKKNVTFSNKNSKTTPVTRSTTSCENRRLKLPKRRSGIRSATMSVLHTMPIHTMLQRHLVCRIAVSLTTDAHH